jgi:hypothetical protein
VLSAEPHCQFVATAKRSLQPFRALPFDHSRRNVDPGDISVGDYDAGCARSDDHPDSTLSLGAQHLLV